MLYKSHSFLDTYPIGAKLIGYIDEDRALSYTKPTNIKTTLYYLGKSAAESSRLVGWKEKEPRLNFGWYLSQEQLDTYHKINVPSEFKNGYGWWLDREYVLEPYIFNANQICKICSLPAPHIELTENYICQTCKIIIGLNNEQ